MLFSEARSDRATHGPASTLAPPAVERGRPRVVAGPASWPVVTDPFRSLRSEP